MLTIDERPSKMTQHLLDEVIVVLRYATKSLDLVSIDKLFEQTVNKAIIPEAGISDFSLL